LSRSKQRSHTKSRTTPWSPSVAREAAREALCRYRTTPQRYSDLETKCVALLGDDRAFDSAEALVLATWIYIPDEVRDHLDRFCRTNGLGDDHEALRARVERVRSRAVIHDVPARALVAGAQA
jgi:hypothetical protein